MTSNALEQLELAFAAHQTKPPFLPMLLHQVLHGLQQAYELTQGALHALVVLVPVKLRRGELVLFYLEECPMIVHAEIEVGRLREEELGVGLVPL
ncbi:hypothetical protein NUW54_g5107 [Trametes sanguinea]|uniref:Uncharacterized protein n=1 Tax=Trametes sanguinea TaxID=158606 RepID=A0ACC1PW17_9APHY|nr:hypothetical protein NUW54_g5107 [Trametes sanguinea]